MHLYQHMDSLELVHSWVSVLGSHGSHHCPGICSLRDKGICSTLPTLLWWRTRGTGGDTSNSFRYCGRAASLLASCTQGIDASSRKPNPELVAGSEPVTWV